MSNMRTTLLAALMTLSLYGCTQTPEQRGQTEGSPKSAHDRVVVVSKVVAQQITTQTKLPGDLLAYRDVAIYPKVKGYIQWIGVDRGSVVKQGELIAHLSAPELEEQSKESANEARAAGDERTQARADLRSLSYEQASLEAKLKAEEDSYKRLKDASSYPGIIAGNDLEIAQKKVEADKNKDRSYDARRASLVAKIQALNNKEKAANDALHSTKDIEEYLRIVAPFNGVITERNVHEGSFVSPPGSNDSKPLLRLQQLQLLRLLVPVPECDVSAIAPGATVSFTLSAFPGETFTGIVRRIGHALDLGTRTMPVELDVDNPETRLAPGMYAQVLWPVSRQKPSILVPKTAVVRTTERTFVIRIKDGVAQWVDVKTGLSIDDLVEVFGSLTPDDAVATRGSDELREGTHVSVSQEVPATTEKQGG